MKTIALTACLLLTLVPAAISQQDNESHDPHQERLQALPYLAWSTVEADELLLTGAMTHRPEAVTPGINLYGTAGEPAAYLVDNEGIIVHRWFAETEPWHCYKPTREGDLYAIAEGGTLLKVSWNSELLWSIPGRFHHDLAIAPDGTFYIISSKNRVIEKNDREFYIVDNLIDHRKADGTLISQFSLYDILKRRLPARRLDNLFAYDRVRFKEMEQPRKEDDPFEVLHANTIEVLTRPVAEGRPGDLLITFKHWNQFMIFRPDPPSRIWVWGKQELENPHGATQAPEGIMYFNNNAVRFISAAGLMDPESNEKIWDYTREGDESFYTSSFGYAQPLASGNVLITITEKGFAIEVTRSGETVWEFWNPEFSEDGTKRARIERMTRYPESFFHPLSDPAGTQAA